MVRPAWVSPFVACLLPALAVSVGSGSVEVLTTADFESRVRDGKESPWLIKFFAPWCGHCKRLTPTWEELAKRLTGTVHVATVDCTQERQLGDDFDIEGFPTLKLIANGRVYTYKGERSADALEAWARGGFEAFDSEALPKDRPAQERMLKATFSFLWAYGMPAALLLLGVLLFYVCSTGTTSEEDVARRKAFEARMAECERKLAEKATAGKGSGARQAEGAKGGDEKKDD